MRAGKARSEHRIGQACHKRWAAYGKPQEQNKTEKFTTLLHHVDVRLLRESYLSLRRDASPGVDGMTWEDYGLDLESRLVKAEGDS